MRAFIAVDFSSELKSGIANLQLTHQLANKRIYTPVNEYKMAKIKVHHERI